MNIISNEKTFNAALRTIATTGESLRDTVQACIIYGLEQYAQPEGSNTNALTAVLTACIGVQALPTKTIKAYIQAHANVAWRKSVKDKVLRFGKNGKVVEVTMPTVTWYEFSTAHQAQEDTDTLSKVSHLVALLARDLKNGKIRKGQEEVTDKVLTLLAPLVPVKAEKVVATAIAA